MSKRIEDQHCVAFYGWFCMQWPQYEGLLHHSPNEGKRSIVFGSMLKRMGLQRGWPDYTLAVPRAPYHGLYIEMKLPEHKNRKQPSHQVEKLEKLAKQGYCTAFAFGWDEARLIVLDYLQGKD